MAPQNCLLGLLVLGTGLLLLMGILIANLGE